MREVSGAPVFYVDCTCANIRDEWDSVYEMTKERDVSDEELAEMITSVSTARIYMTGRLYAAHTTGSNQRTSASLTGTTIKRGAL